VKNRYGGNWHFLTPRVVDAVLKEFDIKITRQQAESHEPNKAAGKTLAKKWGDMFHAIRERFQNKTADIHRSNYRYWFNFNEVKSVITSYIASSDSHQYNGGLTPNESERLYWEKH